MVRDGGLSRTPVLFVGDPGSLIFLVRRVGWSVSSCKTAVGFVGASVTLSDEEVSGSGTVARYRAVRRGAPRGFGPVHRRRHAGEHILQRHGVTWEEVEEAVLGDARGRLRRRGLAERGSDETVYEHHGLTLEGRYLMVALLYLGHGVAMPITAREMTRSERRNRYE